MAKSSPLYRDDMDNEPCGRPGCDHRGAGHHMQIVQTCHPYAGLDVEYQDGIMIVNCHSCDGHVVSLRIESKIEIKSRN